MQLVATLRSAGQIAIRVAILAALSAASLVSVAPAEAATSQLAGAAGCVVPGGISGVCATASAVAGGTNGIATSPDGSSLYAVSAGADSVLSLSRDASTGALAQLLGADGCVSDQGAYAGCAVGAGLATPNAVVVSADGRHVYVASSGSDGIAAFGRDLTDGRLTQLAGLGSCISSGAGVGCGTARAMDAADSLAISPDGAHLYVASSSRGTIAVLSRDAASGALSQALDASGCLSVDGLDDTGAATCVPVPRLSGVGELAISADGASAYAAASVDGSVLAFSRDAATGALSWLAGADGCISDQGAALGCADGTGLAGATSVDVTDDGSSVYVASSSGYVASFSRDAATGVLTQLLGPAGCLSDVADVACDVMHGAGSISSITAAADGSQVYLVGAAGVAVLARDGVTGALAQGAGTGGCFTAVTDASCTLLRNAITPTSAHATADGDLYVGDADVNAAVVALGSPAAACPDQSVTVRAGSLVSLKDACGGLDPSLQSVTVIGAPAHGSTGAWNPVSRSLSYVADAAFDGVDSFVISATDGTDTANAVISVTVLPQVPVSLDRPEIGGVLAEGHTLTTTDGTWTSNAAPSFTYRWQRCTAVGDCADIAGATASSFALTEVQVGWRMRVVVIAANAGGSGSTTSTISDPVTASGPVNVTPPSIAGAAVERTTLTGSAGTWTTSRPATYTYRWERCLNGTCAAITNATTLTYRLAAADIGYTVRLKVTGTSAGGVTILASATTAVVVAAAPVSTVRPAITGKATQGSILTTSSGSWSSSRALTYVYAWHRCDVALSSCAPIAGATTTRYTLTPADLGTVVRSVVTATNSGGSVQATSLPTAVVAVPAPTMKLFAAKIVPSTNLAVAWTAPTPTGVVTSYDLQYTEAGANAAFGAPVAWQSGIVGTTSTLTGATPGTTYCFQVRGRNSAGDTSAWSAAQCIAVALDDASLALATGFTSVVDAAAYLGSYRTTTTTGATLTSGAVQTKSIRVIADRCATCGTIKVMWNGVAVGTYSLYASTTRRKQVIGAINFSTVRSGTVDVVVTSTGGKTVRVDGLGLSRA